MFLQKQFPPANKDQKTDEDREFSSSNHSLRACLVGLSRKELNSLELFSMNKRYLGDMVLGKRIQLDSIKDEKSKISAGINC